MSRTSTNAPEVVSTSVVAASEVNEITSTESNELRGTLRERFEQYNLEATDQGALIEGWWRLVKDEPVSTTHADSPMTEDGTVVLPNDAKSREASALWSNFAPRKGGRRYSSEDGAREFVCTYKLTPISTKEDGTPSGKKCYLCGKVYLNGEVKEVSFVEITKIKNLLFGKGGWYSRKGEAQGVPTSMEEVESMSTKWAESLTKKLEEVEEILESYTDGGEMPDFTPLKEAVKARAYGHAEALYLAWKAEEEAKAEARAEAKATKDGEKLAAKSPEEILAALKKSGQLDAVRALLGI